MKDRTKEIIRKLLRDPDNRIQLPLNAKETAGLLLEFDRAGKDPDTLGEEMAVLLLDDDLRTIFVRSVVKVIDILLNDEYPKVI